jgi:hypothetical protein
MFVLLDEEVVLRYRHPRASLGGRGNLLNEASASGELVKETNI